MRNTPYSTYFRAGVGEIPAYDYMPKQVTGIVQYVLSFLKGGSHVIESAEAKLGLFRGKGASSHTVAEFIDHLIDRGMVSADRARLYAEVTEPASLGSLGPCYGSMWRFYPTANEEIHRVSANLTLEQMPSDLKQRIEQIWEGAEQEERDSIGTKENLAIQLYYSVYDQMHEAILHLQSDQKSSPFPIYNEMPAWKRLSKLPDAANLISGRTSLAIQDKAFSVCIQDSELELTVWAPGVNQLSQINFLITFYSILASVLAKHLQVREYSVTISHGLALPLPWKNPTSVFLQYSKDTDTDPFLLEEDGVVVVQP